MMADNLPKVWAFRPPGYMNNRPEEYRMAIAKSVREQSKSRFGWSLHDYHNLNRDLSEFNLSESEASEAEVWRGKVSQLSNVGIGDWIVHINAPWQDQCLAVRVADKSKEELYGFDGGIVLENEPADFRHYLNIDTSIILQINRKEMREEFGSDLDPEFPKRLSGSWEIKDEDFRRALRNLRESLHK